MKGGAALSTSRACRSPRTPYETDLGHLPRRGHGSVDGTLGARTNPARAIKRRKVRGRGSLTREPSLPSSRRWRTLRDLEAKGSKLGRARGAMSIWILEELGLAIDAVIVLALTGWAIASALRALRLAARPLLGAACPAQTGDSRTLGERCSQVPVLGRGRHRAPRAG
jgi:hypothetical protein